MLDRENVVRQELFADQLRVGLDCAVGVGGDDVPGQRVVPVQPAQQRREPGDLAGFRAGHMPGQHGPGAVGGGGQQVRDEAVRPGRAAHGLAVHRDSGQPSRPGQGKHGRARARAAGQARPGAARQRLRAQRREDPHHRLRMRRHPHPQRVLPGPGRGQHLLRRRVHPRGHVLHRGVPAQHRPGAQRQHRRQRVPDPARVPRITHRREALQQVPARRRRQRRGPAGKLPRGLRRQGFRSGGGHGHGRLDGQRDLRQGK